MDEQGEKTITIKKSDLWKYTTFVLGAIVIIGAIMMFSGGSSNGGNNGATNGGKVDLSIFENTDLYPSLGPEDASNVVIEFADFQCPWCAIASGLPSWVKEAAKTNQQVATVLDSAGNVQAAAEAGELRLIYVPMSFLGQESVYAAEAAYCAHEQGKFWEMHDVIFTAQTEGENTGKYNKDKLVILAKQVSGLDQAKFKVCLDTDKYLSDVQQAAAEASTAASGTPTFYVNGQKAQPVWSQIEAMLN